MNYLLTAIVKSVLAETWTRVPSDERREHDRLCKLAGSELNSAGAARIPGHALRDLNTTTGQGLAGTTTHGGEYIASLAGDSAAMRLGARIVTVPAQTSVFAVPRATAGLTSYWLSTETAQVVESQPTLGQVVAAPKILAVFAQISRQLLLQAPHAEQVLREELRRSAAAALDAAIFNGSGISGEPSGIVGTAGIGAFTGGSLDMAALRNAQYDLANAKAISDPSKVAYVTTPAVAEILAKRPRVASSDRMLLEGSSFEGTIEGVRAIASASMPASTAILADWSSCWVAEFDGGLQIDVDPFTNFSSGIVGIRLLLPCDVLLARPAAFSVATSIT